MVSQYKTHIAITVLIGVVGLGVATAFIQSDSLPEEKKTQSEGVSLQEFSNQEYGVSLMLPKDAEIVPTNEADETDKIFLRAQQVSSPQYLITARAETGLRGPAQISSQSVLELVVNGAYASLPSRYEEYKQISAGKIELNGETAHQITFSYKGPSGTIAKQRLVFVAPTDDSALYFSMQATEPDFDKVDRAIFSPLQMSIKL